jgi:hypothetical protein
MNTLYCVDGRLDVLAVTDVIAVEGPEGRTRGSDEPVLIQITNKRMMTGKAFLQSLLDDPSLKQQVEEQVGREVAEDDQLRIVEFKVTSRWAIEQFRSDDTPGGGILDLKDRRVAEPTNPANFRVGDAAMSATGSNNQ